jgi:poly(A) polymerase
VRPVRIELKEKIFETISNAAEEIGVKAYVVGGYVRDHFLQRNSKDIDIVAVGNGIDLARAVAKKLNIKKIAIFKTFGTAQIKAGELEIEFVGARRESYSQYSRKPIVEDGSLSEDQYRRDFTINALAASLSKKDFGKVLDPFNGLEDIKNRIIRTPLDPLITFSDDPLRMIRGMRFASQLGFEIDNTTYKAICENISRIEIVSKERIVDEFNKILLSPKPSVGLMLLESSGMLNAIFPQLQRLKGVEIFENKKHKENFEHTLQVVDHISLLSNDLWLRWAALLHDIGKPVTKQFNKVAGWTFHGHEVIGSRLVAEIFRELRLPLNEKMKYVQKLVLLHLRPIALVHEVVTDSAVRRLLFEAGDDIEDLMQLAEADITSKNETKVRTYLNNFKIVRQKLKEVEEKDRVRNMQPPVSGEEIMQIFNLPPCKIVGDLKNQIKDAILDGIVDNERDAVLKYLFQIAKDKGIEPVKL